MQSNYNQTGVEEVRQSDMVDFHEHRQKHPGNTDVNNSQEETQESERRSWKLDIDKVVRALIRSRENVQVTFLHRYIYQLDDPKILVALYTRLARKLAFMGILPPQCKTPEYDEAAFKYAVTQYREGDPKFYSEQGTKRNAELLEES